MIYKLSEEGRSVTFAQWRKWGGCGIANNSMAPAALGPVSRWDGNVTLGAIEDACPATGRSLARFACERLRKPQMASPYGN